MKIRGPLLFLVMLAIMAWIPATIWGEEKVEMPEGLDLAAAKAYTFGEIPYKGPQVTYTGPPMEIRFSTYFPKLKMVTELYDPLTKRLEEESNGKLSIKFFWGGALHGAQDGFKACMSDVTDFSQGYVLWQPSSFQLMHIISLPFVFSNAVVGTRVINELYPKYFKKEYEALGVYLARETIIPTYNIYSKKPIRRLDDFKGLKIRSGGGSMAQVVMALGAVPLVLPTAEVFTAYQRGMYDLYLGTDMQLIMFKIIEIARCRTELNVFVGSTELAQNKKTFDQLPPDLKRVFYNWQQKVAMVEAQLYHERWAALGREKMKKKGFEFINLPPEDLEKMKAAVKPVWDQFIAKNEAKGLPAKQLVDDLEKLTKKYSAMTWSELMKLTIDHPVQGIIDF